MNKGIFLVAALVAAVSLAMLGCGSDDSAGSLTRAEYIKQGNAICKKGEEERLDKIGKALAKLDNSKELNNAAKAKFVRTVALPPYEKQTENLKELGLPDGEEEEAEAVVEAMEGAARKVEDEPVAALTTGVPFEEANKAATDFGLKSCAV
ncbi:MAG TPA: hypothetical protein VIV13_05070 [Solirubrobacterales bacterium]